MFYIILLSSIYYLLFNWKNIVSPLILILIFLNSDYLDVKVTIIVIISLIILNFLRESEIQNLILYFIFIFSSLWLINSTHLVSIWLSLECQSFSLILILFYDNKNKIENIEAILKYFFVSAISSIVLLLGVFNVLLSSDTLILSFINVWESSNYFLLLIIFPFILKLALTPFHIWAPEIYQGLSIAGIACLSVIPKLSLFIVIVNISLFNNMLFLISIFSIIVAAIGGLNQINLKTLIAYSGIGHLGFVFLAFSLNSTFFVSLSFMYLLVYLFSSLGVLLILFYKTNSNLIIQWSNFFYYNRFISVIMLTFILSWLGFPPLSGFLVKWSVIVNLFKENNMIFIIILTVLSVMISSFYYLRLFKVNISETKNFYLAWENIGFVDYNFIKINSFLVINWLLTSLIIINPNPLFYFSQIFINDFMKFFFS